MGSGAKGGLENPLWTVLVAFFCCFLVPANARNTVNYIYTVFATFACKRCFLQHVDNRVNTNVFARRRPQNYVNTLVFAFGLRGTTNISIGNVFAPIG